MACTWELLYIALIIEQDDLRRSLIDSILQILTSDFSALISLTKANAIIRSLFELY